MTEACPHRKRHPAQDCVNQPHLQCCPAWNSNGQWIAHCGFDRVTVDVCQLVIETDGVAAIAGAAQASAVAERALYETSCGRGTLAAGTGRGLEEGAAEGSADKHLAKA